MSFKRSLTLQRLWVQREREAILFLAWVLQRDQQDTGNSRLALAMAESCQFQPYTGSNCRKKKGWPWGVAESSLAHSDGVWRQISVDFQMDILAFVLSAVTSNLLSGCRSANRGPQEPLWWEIPNTRAQCLLVGRQALPWGDHNPDSAWLPQAGQVRVQSRTQTSMFFPSVLLL